MSIFSKSKAKLDGLAESVTDSDIGKKLNIDKPKASVGILIIAGSVIAMSVYFVFYNNSVSCSSAIAQQTVIDIANEQNSMKFFIRINGSPKGLENETCEDCNTAENSLNQAKNSLNQAKAAAVALTQECMAIPSVTEQSYDDECPEITDSSQNFTTRGAEWWGAEDFIYDSDLQRYVKHNSPRRVLMAEKAGAILDQWAGAERALRMAERALRMANESNDAARSARVKQAWLKAVENIAYSLENIILTEKNGDTGSVSCKATLVADVPEWGGANLNITYVVERTSDGDIYATVWGL